MPGFASHLHARMTVTREVLSRPVRKFFLVTLRENARFFLGSAHHKRRTIASEGCYGLIDQMQHALGQVPARISRAMNITSGLISPCTLAASSGATYCARHLNVMTGQE
jgi:hypothetical protein